MDGIGSKMSPKERYFRSLYLMYQVCTEVLRHYFDDKNPPDRLVQYLLDKRLEFEKEERKIPNYQWIQLYPEGMLRVWYIGIDNKTKSINEVCPPLKLEIALELVPLLVEAFPPLVQEVTHRLIQTYSNWQMFELHKTAQSVLKW